MRVLSFNTLAVFWTRHPETESSLTHWYQLVSAAAWASSNDVMLSFPKAKVLNAERVRFEIAGGNYRLIVAFKFKSQIAFIKFIGTHAEYDRIDPLTVSLF